MARVAVVFTGGTIAMRHDPGAGGNVPVISGAELLASVDGVADIADVEPIDWGLVPASHLTFAQILDIGRVVRDALRRPDVDGAVVVQGTDVIEETAFAWDLLPLGPKPIVVVGAMRSASQDAYDGPENLRNAIAVAADPGMTDQGVVVAMASEIHGADDVRKTHSHAHATFKSPNLGPVGFVAGARVSIRRRRSPCRLPRMPERAALPVALVTAALELEPPVIAPAAAGLVVSATGGGNTSPALLEVARQLIGGGVPVALTTRCPSGLAMPGYGFPGGSSTWWEAGAIFTGTLDALKARVLLALGIGAGLTVPELAAMCKPYGGGVRGAT